MSVNHHKDKTTTEGSELILEVNGGGDKSHGVVGADAKAKLNQISSQRSQPSQLPWSPERDAPHNRDMSLVDGLACLTWSQDGRGLLPYLATRERWLSDSSGTWSPPKEQLLPSCCAPVRLCPAQAQVLSRQADTQTAALGAHSPAQRPDTADRAWHTDAMEEQAGDQMNECHA